jgi:hypothetical protein
MSKQLPEAEAIQLVQHLRREQQIGNISLVDAAKWLGGLTA